MLFCRIEIQKVIFVMEWPWYREGQPKSYKFVSFCTKLVSFKVFFLETKNGIRESDVNKCGMRDAGLT